MHPRSKSGNLGGVGGDLSHAGNMAKSVNGNARAIEKPSIPTAGAANGLSLHVAKATHGTLQASMEKTARRLYPSMRLSFQKANTPFSLINQVTKENCLPTIQPLGA